MHCVRAHSLILGKNLCLSPVPNFAPPFLNYNLYVFGATKKSPACDLCTALDCLNALIIFITFFISLSSLGLNLYLKLNVLKVGP